MAQRALVTGVAGFIGSHVLDYLLDRTVWDVHGIDNLSPGSLDNIRHRLTDPRFRFDAAACTDLETLIPYRHVFHLAALPRIQPSFERVNEHVIANVLQATHLLDLMVRERHYPRFVYSGSSAIYGTPTRVPTDETERPDCLSPYALQKYEVEQYLRLLSTQYPLDYVTLRYFNLYGSRSFNPANPFSAYSSVVGIFLDRWRRGQPLPITGDGRQRRDFAHVGDVASANHAAAVRAGPLNTALNIGFGATLSILDLATMISPDREFIQRREGEAEVTFADIAQARRVLGWKPVHRLEDYLREETRRR